MAIMKTVLQVTIMHHAADRISLEDMSLAEIGEAIDGGPMVGAVELVSRTTVAGDEVEEQLKALGNDGTFFAGEFADGDDE